MITPVTQDQRLVRQLRVDAYGVEVLIGPHTASTLREAAEALEQAATDAARIAALTAERDFYMTESLENARAEIAKLQRKVDTRERHIQQLIDEREASQ